MSRFLVQGDTVLDQLTRRYWMRRADLTSGPVSWTEALAAVAAHNREPSQGALWRLPNINELESLVDSSAHSPALPHGHPFEAVQAAYWSSTTSLFEPDWAWALYIEKGAVGVGQNHGRHFHVWPVRQQA